MCIKTRWIQLIGSFSIKNETLKFNLKMLKNVLKKEVQKLSQRSIDVTKKFKLFRKSAVWKTSFLMSWILGHKNLLKTVIFLKESAADYDMSFMVVEKYYWQFQPCIGHTMYYYCDKNMENNFLCENWSFATIQQSSIIWIGKVLLRKKLTHQGACQW